MRRISLLAFEKGFFHHSQLRIFIYPDKRQLGKSSEQITCKEFASCILIQQRLIMQATSRIKIMGHCRAILLVTIGLRPLSPASCHQKTQPHGHQRTELFLYIDSSLSMGFSHSPGKNTGMGCHVLLQGNIYIYMKDFHRQKAVLQVQGSYTSKDQLRYGKVTFLQGTAGSIR